MSGTSEDTSYDLSSAAPCQELPSQGSYAQPRYNWDEVSAAFCNVSLNFWPTLSLFTPTQALFTPISNFCKKESIPRAQDGINTSKIGNSIPKR